MPLRTSLRVALVHQFLETLVQSDRRILATGQVVQLPVVCRRMDGNRDRFRNIDVLLHFCAAEAGHLGDARFRNPLRMRELKTASENAAPEKARLDNLQIRQMLSSKRSAR